MNSNPYISSSLDDFLEEDEILSEVNALAFKRVLAWQVEQAMLQKKLSKTAMAKSMKTSRAALDRFLDPENTSVTLKTIERAARVTGKKLRLELVDIP
jgi:antitoxin HicB